MSNGRRYRRQAKPPETITRTPGVESSAETRRRVAELTVATDEFRAYLVTLPETEQREALMALADHTARLLWGAHAEAEALIFGELPS